MSEAATGQTQTDPGAAPADTSAAAPAPAPASAQQDTQQVTTTPTDGQPTDGNKPADDENGDKPGDQKQGDAKTGAPDEYADFTIPEGVEMDAELTTDLKAMAKELGLSQEQAQRVADLGIKQAQGLAAKQTQVLTEAGERWATEARADKEFGGEKFEENLGLAKKAVDAFGTPELKNLLNETKLGNHPEILRFMVRAGKAISQDRFEGGRAAPSGEKRSAEDRLYGNKSK